MSLVRDLIEEERTLPVLPIPETDSVLTGTLIMWPLDTPPAGYLSCDGSTHNVNDHPALGALLGGSPGGTFTTPVINFAKNSAGSGTLTQEAESVGTHGHDVNGDGSHSHGFSGNPVGDHIHASAAQPAPYPVGVAGGSWSACALRGDNTGLGGAHTPSGSITGAGTHSHTVADHTGTNQPACTRVHFCIKADTTV